VDGDLGVPLDPGHRVDDDLLGHDFLGSLAWGPGDPRAVRRGASRPEWVWVVPA
jgi:hypothetical protein